MNVFYVPRNSWKGLLLSLSALDVRQNPESQGTHFPSIWKASIQTNSTSLLTSNGSVEDSMLVLRPDFIYSSVLNTKEQIARHVKDKITRVQIIFQGVESLIRK